MRDDEKNEAKGKVVERHQLELVEAASKAIQAGSLEFIDEKLVEPAHLVTFKQHVRNLRSSTLFNLSLASTELFHSNFLAWLLEQYPNQVGPLFAGFTKTRSASCEGLKVYREQHKIDLTIEFPKEALYVENKVKSLASLDQLKEYSDKIKKHAHKTKARKTPSYLLLSLIHPSFLSSSDPKLNVDGTLWHFLSYKELARQLEPVISSISVLNSYHGALLRDYVGFVRSLVDIAAHISVDWNNEDAPFFRDQERNLLREIRVYDLIEKLRYAQLAEKIKEKLMADGRSVLSKTDFQAKGTKPGVFMLDSALYRGEALCEFWYLVRGGENRVALGVMFQGHKIKVSVLGSGPSVEKVAEELMRPKAGQKVWFDLARIPSDSPEMPEKKDFCNYSGKVFYRYKQITQSSSKAIVELLVTYARSIVKAEKTLSRQIATAFDSGRSKGG
jgi:PD-(D/E)XK nuclease superfamily